MGVGVDEGGIVYRAEVNNYGPRTFPLPSQEVHKRLPGGREGPLPDRTFYRGLSQHLRTPSTPVSARSHTVAEAGHERADCLTLSPTPNLSLDSSLFRRGVEYIKIIITLISTLGSVGRPRLPPSFLDPSPSDPKPPPRTCPPSEERDDSILLPHATPPVPQFVVSGRNHTLGPLG